MPHFFGDLFIVPEIKDALPIPEQCDVCCSANIVHTTNDVIYGKQYGEWPMCYFCKDCRAAVGCHSGTDLPLGRMADRSTRTLRSRAHNEFDKIWRDGLMSRSRAYQWLAIELKIDESQCHISWLSKDQLKDVITLSANFHVNYSRIMERRKEKRNAKQAKQSDRRGERKPSDASYIRKRKSH